MHHPTEGGGVLYYLQSCKTWKILHLLCLRRRFVVKQLWGRSYRSQIMVPPPPFLCDLTHRFSSSCAPNTWREGGAVWGRSLAFKNKPHCSSGSHACLPLIFLLQPLAFFFFCLHCSFSYNVRAFPAFLSAGQICTVRTHPLRESWSI